MKVTWIQKNVNNQRIPEIMQLWNDFFSQGHMEKLWEGNLIAVYSNYSCEDYKTADFDLLVWRNRIHIDWYETIEIPEAKYKKYTASWAWPEVVQSLWQEIWNDTSIQRAYTIDYELYEWSPESPLVTIFIAVK